MRRGLKKEATAWVSFHSPPLVYLFCDLMSMEKSLPLPECTPGQATKIA